MAAQSFYLLGFLLVLFLVAFVGYYGWRLATARKSADNTDQRLQAFLRQEMQSDVSAPVGRPWNPASQGGSEGAALPPEAKWGSSSPGPATAMTRTYERRVGLSALSAEPVFARRSATGEVTVQVGGRPPMPLTFVLDPKARAALQEVVMQAAVDLGPSWSIVASEDAEGRLQITRLG